MTTAVSRLRRSAPARRAASWLAFGALSVAFDAAADNCDYNKHAMAQYSDVCAIHDGCSQSERMRQLTAEACGEAPPAVRLPASPVPKTRPNAAAYAGSAKAVTQPNAAPVKVSLPAPVQAPVTVTLPAIDGLKLDTADNVLQQIEVRAFSFGPGFCGVSLSFAGDTRLMAAPPLTWSDWIKFGPAVTGGAYALGFSPQCATGALGEVRFVR